MSDALLLVHGFPLDGTMWEPQVEALSGSVQVLAPSLPGFGSQPGVGANTAVKTALTVAALGTTAYSGLHGARLGNAVDVKTEGGTVPAENTPDDVFPARHWPDCFPQCPFIAVATPASSVESWSR